MKDRTRFIITYSEGSELSTKTMILVDRVTGVNYLFTKNGYGGGLTVLVDADGKPVVTPVNFNQ